MDDPKVCKPREAGETERVPSDADDRPVPLDEPTEPTPPVDDAERNPAVPEKDLAYSPDDQST